MFEAYTTDAASNRPLESILSRSTFLQLCATLTAGDTQLKKAIGCVVGFLVNDAFDMLKQVIIKLPNDVQEHLLVEMEFVMAYIKYGFDYRLGDQDTGTCLLHQIEYGLTPATSSPAQTPTAFCSNCKKVFIFAIASRRVSSTTVSIRRQLPSWMIAARKRGCFLVTAFA
jgi:hypothetical protein